ncbi:MAG: patatin-like phospholipase family protein, partial [Halioglobus sp.]|nr:patatin-like phospholipase family protein [Halioglobus sp.]
MAKALSIYLGREAAREIGTHGWTPELFGTLLGASGGPKWFVLRYLDEVLFADFLQRSDRPLTTLGSSIGTWRHACLAMPEPATAIARLERGYLY